MSHSPELVWYLVRNNTSFLVKRNGVEFTSEPNNLRNLNCYRYSGLAQKRTVGIANHGGSVRLTLKSKKASHSRKPASSHTHLTLNKTFRRGAKTISHEVGQYRPDLKQAALARWTKIHSSLKGVSKKQRTRRARKQAPAAAAATQN